MRGIRFAIVLASLSLVAVSLASCSSALTGGSIPPGGVRSITVRGLVVRGDDVSRPVPGATIRILPISRATRDTGTPWPPDDDDHNGDGKPDRPALPAISVDPIGTVRVTTGLTGVFSVAGVAPGAKVVEVYLPADSNLVYSSYLATFQRGEDWYMRLAPLPRKTSLWGTTGIKVLPATIDLRQGETQTITAQLLGPAPTHVAPSLLLNGRCGTISNDGKFVAVQRGTGVIYASIGPFAAAVNVRVR